MASLGLGRALMTLGSGVRDFGNTALSLEQQRRAEAERAAERAENQRRWEVALSMTPGVVPIAGEPTEGIHRDSILADPGMPLRRQEPQFAGAVTPETVTPELSRPEPQSDIRQIHLPGIGKALQTPAGHTRLTDTLAFNPNWQTEQQIAAEGRARDAAEAERLELVETLTPALQASYGDQARSIAEAIARGANLSDLAYQPLTREQMLADNAATRAPQQVYTAVPGGVLNQATGEVRPMPVGTTTNLPAWAQQAVAGNQKQLGIIDTALAELEANPQSVGFWRGFSETINQRVDPSGVPARAAIADLGSLEIRDRSGAAVTAAEFPRLAPFIPAPGDTPEAARMKLERMKRIIEEENAALTGNAPALDAGPTRESADLLVQQQRADWDALARQFGEEETRRRIGPRP